MGPIFRPSHFQRNQVFIIKEPSKKGAMLDPCGHVCARKCGPLKSVKYILKLTRGRKDVDCEEI